MPRKVIGFTATVTGAIFTVIISIYPEPIRKYVSNLVGVPDETIVILGLVIISVAWILAGIILLATSFTPTKTAKTLLDPRFKHVSARLFYPPKRRWHKIRVPERYWWQLWKQTPSRHKLILVKDLKKAYWVGKYGMTLINENKIEWISEEDQDVDQWCKKEGYTLVPEEVDKDKLLEPYFEAEIKNKKSEYRQGEAVFFRTHYRGPLTNGFFDNEITPLTGVFLPNGRPSYWSWDPETLPNHNSGGKLNGYVIQTSNWDWSVPQDAPLGEYRVIEAVHNHLDMQTRPRVAHKEETITVISRFGKIRGKVSFV